MPFWSGAAHVMQFRPIGIHQSFEHFACEAPRVCEKSRCLCPAQVCNFPSRHDPLRCSFLRWPVLGPRMRRPFHGDDFEFRFVKNQYEFVSDFNFVASSCKKATISVNNRRPNHHSFNYGINEAVSLTLFSMPDAATPPPNSRKPSNRQKGRMARQFIYHMQGLTKTYPGSRKVLEDINLSFYPDAKIGVLGVNGSGKSTLLRIMGGIDKEFAGEAWAAEGARVGYLEQEPHLDPAKNVRENVMQGVAPQQAILQRYNELAVNYSDETADEMTKLQDEIEAKGLWDLDSKVDQAMDALRCP